MVRILILLFVSWQASAQSLHDIQVKQNSLRLEAERLQKRAAEYRQGDICKNVDWISLDNLCDMKYPDVACVRKNGCITNVRSAEQQANSIAKELQELKVKEIEAKKWENSPQGKLAKHKEITEATQKDLEYFRNEFKATKESAICKDVNLEDNACVLRTRENFASFCKRRDSCIEMLANHSDGISIKTKALEELKKKENELLAQIAAPAKHPATSVEEIEGQELNLPNPRDMRLEGYNDFFDMAFAKQSHAGQTCVYTVRPVENFPRTGGYALPETAMKWTAGKFHAGVRYTNAEACLELAFMFRNECKRAADGFGGAYLEPSSLEFTSADGKVMTVYSKENLQSGVFKCVENAFFDMNIPAGGTAPKDPEVANAPEITR